MQLRRFRFEVVTVRADGVRLLVSRHHQRGRADRRLIRYPLQPGQIVEILDDGKPIRVSRCPAGAEAEEIPFCRIGERGAFTRAAYHRLLS